MTYYGKTIILVNHLSIYQSFKIRKKGGGVG